MKHIEQLNAIIKSWSFSNFQMFRGSTKPGSMKQRVHMRDLYFYGYSLLLYRQINSGGKIFTRTWNVILLHLVSLLLRIFLTIFPRNTVFVDTYCFTMFIWIRFSVIRKTKMKLIFIKFKYECIISQSSTRVYDRWLVHPCCCVTNSPE